MATCNFCKEDEFQSEQGVKAHLKTCDRYLAEKAKKATAASGSMPQAAVAQNLSAPSLDVAKAIQEQSPKQEPTPTPMRERRIILQAVKKRVIDWYVTSLGQVTSSMRGHAKLMIEQTLARLSLEDIGFEETCELAAGIRDRIYASAFTKQEREAERQRVETAAHKKQEVEMFGALLRADCRKTMFRQQANQHAEAFCQAKKITGWAYLSVLADVKSRLEVCLTGDEPILEAQAIVRSVLEDRFSEAEAMLAAAQATADEHWRREMEAALVLATGAGLVGLSLWYPEQTVAFFNWLERTFGFVPGAKAGTSNPEASGTTSATASAETRPPGTSQRKGPVMPPDPPFSYAPSGEPMQGQA
jgi:hypothetical protein